MIFQNTCYLVKNSSRNNTNTKNYSYLDADYIFEATFTYNPKPGYNEMCVIGRGGYPFGIYTMESDNLSESVNGKDVLRSTVKWCWFVEKDGNIEYRDLFFGPGSTKEKQNTHLKWWKNYILHTTPVQIEPHIVDGLANRWGLFSPEFDLNSIENKILRNWAIELDTIKNKKGIYTPEVVKITVYKKSDFFEFYINDILYDRSLIGDLIDNKNQTIYIGTDDPFKKDGNLLWFDGEIYSLKIYHSNYKSEETLFLNVDFNRKTHFKLFDLSGNGNHPEIFETQEQLEKINRDFTQKSRPAKIVNR